MIAGGWKYHARDYKRNTKDNFWFPALTKTTRMPARKNCLKNGGRCIKNFSNNYFSSQGYLSGLTDKAYKTHNSILLLYLSILMFFNEKLYFYHRLKIFTRISSVRKRVELRISIFKIVFIFVVPKST